MKWKISSIFHPIVSITRFSKYLLNLICLIIGLTASSQSAITSVKITDSRRVQKDLWATQYYIYHTKIVYNGNGVILKGAGISDLKLKIDTLSFCKAAIEGTMTIFDSNDLGITLNYGGLSEKPCVDCKKYIANHALTLDKLNRTLWVRAKGKYGDGVKGYKLVPYKSIAVDPSVIKIGSIVFIPAMVNVAIPGDTIKHDGYFYAVDIGSAIKDNHIDIFTGNNTTSVLNTIITSDKNRPFVAYIVQDVELKNELEKLHR